jgi:hypothetical protein
LVLSYQGLEEENLDQKSPGPPGWGLMQRASSSLITKKQKMLKNQKLSLGKETFRSRSVVKQKGIVFVFRKMATAVVGPEIDRYCFLPSSYICALELQSGGKTYAYLKISLLTLRYGRSQWPLGCWDRGFESHRWHGSLSVVSVVRCQVDVSATGWSLVQRSPTDCGASLCVI